MKSTIRAVAVLALAAIGGLSTTAVADEPSPPSSIQALVHKECGSCHIAYLPKFMPKPAWTALFDTLGSHFGENAQLYPDVAAEVRRYYLDNAAGLYWTSPSTQEMPRITAQAWWKRGMGKLDVSNPRIRSRANCGGCHTHADWYMAVRE